MAKRSKKNKRAKKRDSKRSVEKPHANGVDLRKLPKDERPKPTTGQSAKERDLPWEALNEDEQHVVKLLDGKGDGPRIARSVEFLAEAFDEDNPKLKVRNALRRAVSCGWVDHVGRGTYQISERGRKRRARA